MVGGRYSPPFAIVDTMVATCTGVTPISWPIGIDPIVVGFHRDGGFSESSSLRWKLDAGALAEPEGVNVLVKAVLAHSFRQVRWPPRRSTAPAPGSLKSHCDSRLSYMMASRSSCTIRPATLIWPPSVWIMVVRCDHMLLQCSGICHQFEDRTRLINIADRGVAQHGRANVVNVVGIERRADRQG